MRLCALITAYITRRAMDARKKWEECKREKEMFMRAYIFAPLLKNMGRFVMIHEKKPVTVSLCVFLANIIKQVQQFCT